jgi:opacity protein-like surface antigen
LNRGVLVVALAILVFCMPVQAREYKNDLSFGLGAFTFPDIAETTKDVGLLAVTLGLVSQEAKRDGPAYIFKYGRFVKEDLRLSLSAGYQKFKADHYLVQELWYTTEISYLDFMVRGDYYWLNREWVQLYSGAGLGIAMVTEEQKELGLEETEYWFAFHVNAFGCRVGKRVAGFVELGFGYNGILSAGITAAF